jgi:hypothetical protein
MRLLIVTVLALALGRAAQAKELVAQADAARASRSAAGASTARAAAGNTSSSR